MAFEDAVHPQIRIGGLGLSIMRDLLVLDITLPVLDGMSALEQIRRLESLRLESAGGVPAVLADVVTTSAMPSQIADICLPGLTAIRRKSFRRHELSHGLHSLLRL